MLRSTSRKLISVILPTYNQAGYLPAALDSIGAQTYPHYELIVVNDGSTDATAGVLADYQSRHPLTVIQQQNRGLPRALNAGFARAQGDYLTWTSSDNLLLPDMLAVLSSALDENPEIGLVYSDFYLMDQHGHDAGQFATTEYSPVWLLYLNLVHCCFLYRRECMQRVGGYDPKFIYSEDWEYWTRISQHYRMKRVPQSLYRYRLHSASMTAEIERGTARMLGFARFSRCLRRRMPLRYSALVLARIWLALTGQSHPAVDERRRWIEATRRAMGSTL